MDSVEEEDEGKENIVVEENDLCETGRTGGCGKGEGGRENKGVEVKVATVDVMEIVKVHNY